MYKIRFTNTEGEIVTTTIASKKDLNKISKTCAKDSVIQCQVGSGMSTSLHNAITQHNLKVR